MLGCYRDPVKICDTITSQYAIQEKIVVLLSLD